MTRQRALLVVAGLMLLSAALRTSIAFEGGIWRDEALFLGVVGLPSWTEMLAYLRHHESHPPLYYALTRVWLAITGPSDASALALSIIFGVLLVPAVYAFGSRNFGRRVGLVAAAFITFVPSVNEDGSTARPYAFFTLLVLASAYALIAAFDSRRLRDWAVHGLTVAALILTHNWGLLVFAGMVAATFFRVWRIHEVQRLLSGLAVSTCLAAVIYLPWASAFLSQVRAAGHPGIPVSNLAEALRLAGYAVLFTSNATFFPPAESGRWVVVAAVAIAAAILIRAQFVGAKRPKRIRQEGGQPVRHVIPEILIIAFVAVASAAFFSPWTNLLVGRCLSSLTPLLVVTAAAGAVAWAGNVRSPQPAAIIAAFAVTLAGMYAARLSELVAHPRSNARELVPLVQGRYHADDLVILAPGWLASSFNHYATIPMTQIAYPDAGGTRLFDFAGLWNRMEDPRRLSETRNRIDEVARTGGRIWLITDAVSNTAGSDSDREPTTTEVAWAMSKIRTADIRGALVRAFGQPAWSAPSADPMSREEMLVAELFYR